MTSLTSIITSVRERRFCPANKFSIFTKEELEGIRAYGGLFTLTMHPQASGRPSRVLMIREFIQPFFISQKDVWITSPAELVEYWRTAHPPDQWRRWRSVLPNSSVLQ